VAAAHSCGRQPAGSETKDVVSREAAAAVGRGEFAVAASRLKLFFSWIPWAYAHGYVLPSLRDSGNAQLQQL
jgi:hypothetical protein